MRQLLNCFLVASLIFLATPAADGALTFSILNTTIAPGGTGFVDVLVTGAPGDTLGRFGYEFNITGATVQSGDLRFSAIQSKSEQGIAGPPAYIFFGDTDPSNLTSVRGNGGLDPLSLVGTDVLNSLDSIDANGTFLLARLELEHVGPVIGSHDFTVSLNLSSVFTEFDSDFDVATDNSFAPGMLSATSGIVTVSAIPEPSSMMLVALAGLSALGHRRRWAWRKSVTKLPTALQ